jgi:hypothetical protein
MSVHDRAADDSTTHVPASTITFHAFKQSSACPSWKIPLDCETLPRGSLVARFHRGYKRDHPLTPPRPRAELFNTADNHGTIRQARRSDIAPKILCRTFCTVPSRKTTRTLQHIGHVVAITARIHARSPPRWIPESCAGMSGSTLGLRSCHMAIQCRGPCPHQIVTRFDLNESR